MKENNMIVANQGYFSVMYLTYLGSNGNQSLGTVRSKDGAFFPPNLKEKYEELINKGVMINPLAQAVISLARKPVAISFA